MTDPTPDVPPPAQRTTPKWMKILRLTGVGLVVLPVLFITLWIWVALHWSYSEGERAGTLQKFSRKGWLCKTWEGELQISTIPGSAPILWEFSVRDDIVANQLAEAVAHNGRVALEYEEHRGVPSSCFGETPYFVIGMRLVQ
ncbi:MAG: hypothetical protein ABJB33_01045 [Gemmatimonadota bacterium]